MRFWVLLHLEHNTFYAGLSYFSSFCWLIGIPCWDLVCLFSSHRTMYPRTCRLAGHLGVIKHTGLKSWLPSALLINAEWESAHCWRTHGPIQVKTMNLLHTNPTLNMCSGRSRGRGVIFSRSFCFLLANTRIRSDIPSLNLCFEYTFSIQHPLSVVHPNKSWFFSTSKERSTVKVVATNFASGFVSVMWRFVFQCLEVGGKKRKFEVFLRGLSLFVRGFLKEPWLLGEKKELEKGRFKVEK